MKILLAKSFYIGLVSMDTGSHPLLLNIKEQSLWIAQIAEREALKLMVS